MTQRIEFIEIELKKCQLDYGVAPCTAAIGVTGEDKCFNCRATCQDKANLTEENELVRFAKASSNIRFDLDATPNIYIPNITSISHTPAEVSLGESMGLRASISVSFSDHRSPDTDASGDKYVQERNYDPYTQGTYWGKFRARHPFIRGQSMWWVQGTSDQKIEDMERRHFFIETNTGPNAGGTYTITGKDALRLADAQRAMAPKISNGYLKADIWAGETEIELQPFGVGEEYPASGKAAIGGVEVVDFTRVGDVFTIVRGQNKTEDVEHKQGSQFQLCLVYEAQDPADILYDLLSTYANLPTEYLPLADWQYESSVALGRLYSTVIAIPTPVNELINEIIPQTASSMWWDPIASLVRWQILKNPSVDSDSYSDRDIQGSSYSVIEQSQKRVSQVWVWYGQLNPLLNLTDVRNYSSTLAVPDFESEANYGGVPAIRKIYSRWILGSARDTASSIAQLILKRYSTPPRKIGFRLLRDSGVHVPTTAGAYNFQNMFLQNADGSPSTMPIQVVSVNPSATYYEVTAEEITFTELGAADPNELNVFLNDGDTNVNLLDRYLAERPEVTSDSILNVYVGQGITIGSVSVEDWAIVTGTWPVGATINLFNSGQILGRGGRGGNGASANYVGTWERKATLTNPTAGGKGGDAILVQHDINIYNAGIIGGGGGGAGGSGAGWAEWAHYDTSRVTQIRYPAVISGSGGGGGAGYLPGPGGDSGVRTLTTKDYDAPGFGWSFEYKSSAVLVDGKPGLSGSHTTGAENQGNWYHRNLHVQTLNGFSYEKGSLISNYGGTWGRGGNLGQPGQSGDGISVTFGDFPKNSGNDIDTTTSNSTNGAPGGDAGKAIVQSGGTANIIEAGTILGAII